MLSAPANFDVIDLILWFWLEHEYQNFLTNEVLAYIHTAILIYPFIKRINNGRPFAHFGDIQLHVILHQIVTYLTHVYMVIIGEYIHFAPLAF